MAVIPPFNVVIKRLYVVNYTSVLRVGVNHTVTISDIIITNLLVQSGVNSTLDFGFIFLPCQISEGLFRVQHTFRRVEHL